MRAAAPRAVARQLLRADLVALLRRLLARQVALGGHRGDVVALRDQAGEQPLARADVGAQRLALFAQPVQPALDVRARVADFLARRLDLALDRRLLGVELLAHRGALAAAFLAQPLAADDGEQVALHHRAGSGPRPTRVTRPSSGAFRAHQAAARVDEGGDAMHRRVLDERDEGDQRGEQGEGDRGERGDAAPVRRERRADLRARRRLDRLLPKQRGGRSVPMRASGGRRMRRTDSAAFRAHAACARALLRREPPRRAGLGRDGPSPAPGAATPCRVRPRPRPRAASACRAGVPGRRWRRSGPAAGPETKTRALHAGPTMDEQRFRCFEQAALELARLGRRHVSHRQSLGAIPSDR